MHPDDPPLSPIRGLARIMRSVENYQRLARLGAQRGQRDHLVPGQLYLDDGRPPAVIRQFGKQKKIFFVHFRDVRGTPEKYEETFHDDGKTNMAACMRACRDIGRRRVPARSRPHDGRRQQRPARLFHHRPPFALGYIRGLIQSVLRSMSHCD